MKTHEPADDVISRSPGRLSPWSLLRRGLLATIGGACLMLGMALTITMVRPETLSTMGTAQLLGIVVLMVSPAMTLLALRFDRRVLVARQSGASGVVQELADESVIAASRIAAHEAHDRTHRAGRHTRLPEQGDLAGAPEHAV